MNDNLECIMLVDDNADDNFYHERVINKCNLSAMVIVKNNGLDALEYLRSTEKTSNCQPDLIFLDINMPGMNGWEFLKKYSQLDKKLQNKRIIIMLTTSDNPDDESRAKSLGLVSDYITKPLTKELMEEITRKYFKN